MIQEVSTLNFYASKGNECDNDKKKSMFPCLLKQHSPENFQNVL